MSELKLVIGVAGRIGSGKTEVAHLLEAQWGFQYLRYSIVLANWYGTDPSAKARLQQVGWEVMSSDRQRELNSKLIQRVDRDRECVIDGLRHPIDFESLNSEFSSCFYLFFVDTPAEIRFERLRQRYTTRELFIEADSHAVESNIGRLVPLANLVLNGQLPMHILAKQIEDFLSICRKGSLHRQV
jgi:dephospho-CoA kinase